MNQRLQQFLAAENISQAQLADTIEVARASISHVLAGRNKPGYDFIRSLSDHYPKLSLEWLINGKGKMYKQDTLPMGPKAAPSSVTGPAPASIQETEDDYFSEGLFGQAEKPSIKEEPKKEMYGQQVPAARADNPVQAETPPQAVQTPQNFASSAEIKTLVKDTQIPTNKRSITKILVLFDDNTYQEIK